MDEFENNIILTEEEPAAEEVAVEEEAQSVGEEVISEETESAPVKTKKKIQTPIIIAACVLLVAVLGFLGYRVFFNNSVVGTWVLEDEATADEADKGTGESLRYYTFENDGKASITLGTMKVFGTWSYGSGDETATDDQSGSKITVSISYFFDGTFDYTVEGNALTGKKLTIKSEDYSLNFISKSIPAQKVEVDKKFKEVKAVTGSWKNDDYQQTYTFNADGTCSLNQVDTLVVEGTYTVNKEDKIITIKYRDTGENSMDVDYETDKSGDKITFSGIEYEKVK